MKIFGVAKKTFQTEKKLLYYIYRRARSSAGRAPAWHAGGRKFDPCRVHHLNKIYPLERVGFLFKGKHVNTCTQGRRVAVPSRLWRSQVGSSSGPPFFKALRVSVGLFICGPTKFGRRVAVPSRLERSHVGNSIMFYFISHPKLPLPHTATNSEVPHKLLHNLPALEEAPSDTLLK